MACGERCSTLATVVRGDLVPQESPGPDSSHSSTVQHLRVCESHSVLGQVGDVAAFLIRNPGRCRNRVAAIGFHPGGRSWWCQRCDVGVFGFGKNPKEDSDALYLKNSVVLVADGRTRGGTSSPVDEPASSGARWRPVARPASQKGRAMGTGRPRRERSDAAGRAQHRTCRRAPVGGGSPRCRRLLARANPLLPRRCAGATHQFAESGGRTPLKSTRRDSEPGVCPT